METITRLIADAPCGKENPQFSVLLRTPESAALILCDRVEGMRKEDQDLGRKAEEAESYARCYMFSHDRNVKRRTVQDIGDIQ